MRIFLYLLVKLYLLKTSFNLFFGFSPPFNKNEKDLIESIFTLMSKIFNFSFEIFFEFRVFMVLNYFKLLCLIFELSGDTNLLIPLLAKDYFDIIFSIELFLCYFYNVFYWLLWTVISIWIKNIKFFRVISYLSCCY